MDQTLLLLVNFGGPRDLSEIEPFLIELLTDRELIRTKLPDFWHRAFFRRVAKKRAPRVKEDYQLIGGKSPIFETTETLATLFRTSIDTIAFHRYLPSTHEAFFRDIESTSATTILTLPLFPQFSYATTGSIATLFTKRLSPFTQSKLRWIKSYAAHPAFLAAWEERIRSFLAENRLAEEETILLFSAHGLPQTFIEEGDPYQFECEQTYRALLKAFPKAQGKLCYQSKFGKGEWIRPYTDETASSILEWKEPNRNAVVFIPIAFTSDHIETLFEIEELYLPLIAKQGMRALRCPALNLDPLWIKALRTLLQESNFCTNQMLVR